MEDCPEDHERDRPVRDSAGHDVGQPDVRDGSTAGAVPLSERRERTDPVIGDPDHALDGDEARRRPRPSDRVAPSAPVATSQPIAPSSIQNTSEWTAWIARIRAHRSCGSMASRSPHRQRGVLRQQMTGTNGRILTTFGSRMRSCRVSNARASIAPTRSGDLPTGADRCHRSRRDIHRPIRLRPRLALVQGRRPGRPTPSRALTAMSAMWSPGTCMS